METEVWRCDRGLDGEGAVPSHAMLRRCGRQPLCSSGCHLLKEQNAAAIRAARCLQIRIQSSHEHRSPRQPAGPTQRQRPNSNIICTGRRLLAGVGVVNGQHNLQQHASYKVLVPCILSFQRNQLCLRRGLDGVTSSSQCLCLQDNEGKARSKLLVSKAQSHRTRRRRAVRERPTSGLSRRSCASRIALNSATSRAASAVAARIIALRSADKRVEEAQCKGCRICSRRKCAEAHSRRATASSDHAPSRALATISAAWSSASLRMASSEAPRRDMMRFGLWRTIRTEISKQSINMDLLREKS